MILMLTCSVSAKNIDFPKMDATRVETWEVSASSSFISASSNTNQQRTLYFTLPKFMWAAGVMLGSKSASDYNLANRQRLRKIVEDNLFLRNILLMLSNHENLLVQDRAKLYYSDKDPYDALTGSDYYIFVLRRILI